jgi:hypothetical protein
MGTPLTGSTVASTYTGLLKTTDNATLTSSLKALSDGSGNDSALQVSTVASNINGDFSVATSKFTVASASGNTAVAGTLAVTGATSLSSLITSGNATIGGTLGITGGLTIPGTLSVTGASTLTGAVGMGSTLNVTGLSTLASLGVTGAATVGTTLGVTGLSTLASLAVTAGSTLDSLAVTNAATLGSLAVTAGATVGTSLAVTGDLTANGNTTLGNQNTDTLALNSDNITVPNLSPVTVDLSADKVLITDASDSSKVKLAAASAFGINAANAPQIKQTIFRSTAEYPTTTASPGVEITDLTTSITPRSSGSLVLVTVTVNYSKKTAGNWSFYAVFKLTRTIGATVTELGNSTTGATLSGIAPIVYYPDSDTNFLNCVTFQFLDSPSTASAATYKVHVFSPGLTDTLILNTCPSASAGNLTTPSIARVSSAMTLQEFFA